MVDHCDQLLRPGEFDDWSGAVNGLQVENQGRVSRIAAAVDATFATASLAGDSGSTLMVVHHGLFWGPTHPWTGRRYELIRLLVERDIAVYSSHLPLDAHPRLGNNVGLASALGFQRTKPFFFSRGIHLGVAAAGQQLGRETLGNRLTKALGSRPTLLPGGPKTCRKIGIVTGGAGAEMSIAAAEGIDTFITGEGPHWTFAMAEDLGINVFYGGHYATETFGVKALAAHLSKKFRLPWTFIDHPTGL